MKADQLKTDTNMDRIYNAFFNILNQIILMGGVFARADSEKLGWINMRFGLLFFGINGTAIFAWQQSGMSNAVRFYSQTNRVCFFVLASTFIVIFACVMAFDRLGFL